MRITALIRDRRAATAIEYCLVAALVVVPIIVSAGNVGAKITNTLTSVGAAFRVG